MESFDVNLHHLLSKKTLLKDAVVTPEDVIPNPAGLGGGLVSNDMGIITFKDVNKLSWQQFEALALELLAKELGADSMHLTNDGADYGADGLILTSNSLSLIQVKHTKGKSYSGGYNAVKEVHGSEPTYKKHFSKPQTDLFFITNATRFSAKAREVAKDCSVEIIDGNKLLDLLKKHQVSYTQIYSRLDQERYIV
jgi:restriction endonuclease Mrr